MTQGFQLQDGESLYGLGQYNEPIGTTAARDVLMVQTNIGIRVALHALQPALRPAVGRTPRWFPPTTRKAPASNPTARRRGRLLPGRRPDMDAVMRGLRTPTGTATMLPKTAFGLFESKERYQTQARCSTSSNASRADHFPLDNIVPGHRANGTADGTWSGMIWDHCVTRSARHDRHPAPDPYTQFMISIWPSVGNKTELALRAGRQWLGCFGPMEGVASQARSTTPSARRAARSTSATSRKVCSDVGVDALWMDGTEVEVSGAAHDPGTVERDIRPCAATPWATSRATSTSTTC